MPVCVRAASEVLVVVAATIGAKDGPHRKLITLRALLYVCASLSVLLVAYVLENHLGSAVA